MSFPTGLVLRIVSSPPYTTKGSELTWQELDNNLILLGNEWVDFGSYIPAFDPLVTYSGGSTYYRQYNNEIWKFVSATDQTGIIPGTDATIWEASSIGLAMGDGGIGSTGYTGYTGWTGAGNFTGYTGYTGPNSGFTGYTGFTGATGPNSGFTGYTGYTGAGAFTGYTGYTGFTGYTGSGPTGYTGTTGFTGYTGYTGPGSTGYTGYTGYTGRTGYTGYTGAGATGYTGYTGYTGAGNFTGYTGYTGTTGYTGYTGETGYTGPGNFTGYTGYTGPNSGFTGATGPTGPNSGFTGYTGYTGYTGPGNFTGYTGYSGYTGATGYTGAGAFTGYTGYTGYTGRTGYTGYTGYTGPGNFTGYTGYTGAGTTGYTGYTGPIGNIGFTGYTGYTGRTGYTGYTGYTGAGNFTGYTGYTGAGNFTGYTGYTGHTGYTGYTGPGNFTGYTGYTGPNSGFTGATGPTGPNSGFTGYTGYTGYTGAGNFTGYTGYTGFTGFTGRTGYTGYTGPAGSASLTSITAAALKILVNTSLADPNTTYRVTDAGAGTAGVVAVLDIEVFANNRLAPEGYGTFQNAVMASAVGAWMEYDVQTNKFMAVREPIRSNTVIVGTYGESALQWVKFDSNNWLSNYFNDARIVNIASDAIFKGNNIDHWSGDFNNCTGVYIVNNNIRGVSATVGLGFYDLFVNGNIFKLECNNIYASDQGTQLANVGGNFRMAYSNVYWWSTIDCENHTGLRIRSSTFHNYSTITFKANSVSVDGTEFGNRVQVTLIGQTLGCLFYGDSSTHAITNFRGSYSTLRDTVYSSSSSLPSIVTKSTLVNSNISFSSSSTIDESLLTACTMNFGTANGISINDSTLQKVSVSNAGDNETINKCSMYNCTINFGGWGTCTLEGIQSQNNEYAFSADTQTMLQGRFSMSDLSQSLSDPPTAVNTVNLSGITAVWSYVGLGVYRLTFSSPVLVSGYFDARLFGYFNDYANGTYAYLIQSSTTELDLHTIQATLPTDGALLNTALIIDFIP